MDSNPDYDTSEHEALSTWQPLRKKSSIPLRTWLMFLSGVSILYMLPLCYQIASVSHVGVQISLFYLKMVPNIWGTMKKRYQGIKLEGWFSSSTLCLTSKNHCRGFGSVHAFRYPLKVLEYIPWGSGGGPALLLLFWVFTTKVGAMVEIFSC